MPQSCEKSDRICRQEKLDFWENVYGFDMSCIRALAMAEPLVDVVDKDQITSAACKIAEFDIMTVQKSDLNFVVSAPYP